MQLTKWFAASLEKNEWFPKSFTPVFGILLCAGLGYFTALLTGQIKNPGVVVHLIVFGGMFFSGLILFSLITAINYLDKRDGY